MRLLHVITSLDQGGSEGYLRRLAPALLEQGISQQVVSLVSGGFHASGLRDEGIPVIELDMPRGLPDPRGVWRLRNAIDRFGAHVVHGWLYHANLLSLVASGLIPRRRRPGLVWGIRSAEMDQSRYGVGLKVAVESSAWLSRYVDRIIANSKVGRADHIRLGFAADRFDVIANGVDATRFAPDARSRNSVRAELGLAGDAVLAGVFARNDPIKDLPGILTAISDLDGLETFFAGGGTQDMPLLKGCHFLGARSDVSRLMAACDFTILGSVSEGFPNVVAESLAAGVPVVSTDAGDAADIIGDQGVVVPPLDPVALRRAITTMRDMEPFARRQMGLDGRQRMQNVFMFETAVAKYMDAYQELVEVGRAGQV